MGANPKLIVATIGLVVVFGAKCVSATIHDHETAQTSVAVSPCASVPAELDPVFQQRLVQRARASYERSHPGSQL
jgi:hypothetical protein